MLRGAVYYVAPTGNDANPGTLEHPWRTIQKAADTLVADVPSGNVTVDHNLIDGYRGYEDEVYGEDYVEGDPRFVDPAHGDLHLQSDSPAVDAGSAAEAPAVDLDGDPRPGGAGYDIGADEWRQPSVRMYLPLVLRLW